jgi:hypothetical protein
MADGPPTEELTAPGSKRGVTPGLVLLGLFGLPFMVLSLLVAVSSLRGAFDDLASIARDATIVDTWDVLSLVSGLLSLTAIVGMVHALFRKKGARALLLCCLAWPGMLVIGGSRCDTGTSCQLMDWAALPHQAFAWQVRIRPVTEANEALQLASAALGNAGSTDTPYKARRFASDWIVSSINSDGWPGASAVAVDIRTAATRLVPCPAKAMPCGMDRPVPSDGRTPFRKPDLGLAAVFPATLLVCPLDDDKGEPSGLFGDRLPADEPCGQAEQSREMGLQVAPYRMDGCTVLEARSVPWRPVSPETLKLLRGQSLTLGGFPVQVCELRMSGYVQISAYASAPSPTKQGQGMTLYEAYIVTRPEHLADDLRGLATFMDTARIGRGA